MERKKMSSNTVLKASDLNKSFSGIVAAKDINVTINQGEIVGIIGANGADTGGNTSAGSSYVVFGQENQIKRAGIV